MKEHIADITKLWDRLRIDDEEREEFITAHIGLTMDTIQSVGALTCRSVLFFVLFFKRTLTRSSFSFVFK